MTGNPSADGVIFVLVRPQHPGNVGAAARAMKNLGLHKLVVVDPPAWDPERARWMAPGCDDILDGIRLVATVGEALVGAHRAVATTARHRKQGHLVVDPERFAVDALDQAEEGFTTAVLFGREDFGLGRDDTLRCDRLLRIPTPEHASLNLAQAVLLVAWSVYTEARQRGADAPGRTLGGSRGRRSTASKQHGDARDRAAQLPELEPAVDELIAMLARVGYLRGVKPDKVRLTARQALARAGISVRHLEAVRGMVGRVGWALDHPDADWQRNSGD